MGLLSKRLLLRLGVCATIAFTGVGCSKSGPDRIAVQGQVMLSGKPADAGRVIFIPVGSGVQARAEISGARYTFTTEDGPLVGTYKIGYEPPAVEPAAQELGGKARPVSAAVETPQPFMAEGVEVKADTTELELQLKPGDAFAE